MVGALTWPAIEAQILGQALPRGESWASILLVDVFCVAITGYGICSTLGQMFTKFTVEGIKRWTLLRTLFIAWSEVTSVRKRLHSIEVASSGNKLQIVVFLFKDRKALFSFLRDHVPKDAFQISEAEATIWD